MKTTIETSEGKALVILEGVMDSYNTPEVLVNLEPIFKLQDTEITFDCTKLEFIASNGLRLFLLLRRAVMPHGCNILVKGVSNKLMTIFKAAGFDTLFDFI